jgi:hypothetical protein
VDKGLPNQVEVKAERSELDIRKGSSIPIEKYLGLRSSLEERQKQLEEIIKAESSTQDKLREKIDENNRLLLEKSQLNDQWNSVQTDLADLRDFRKEFQKLDHLESFFPGDWICEFFVVDKSGFVAERTNSLSHELTFEPFHIRDKNYDAHGKLKFKIDHIRYVGFLKTVIFHKIPLQVPSPGDHIATLTMINDSLWVGTEKLPGNLMSYVRYYPANNKPEVYPVYINGKEALNMDAMLMGTRKIDLFANKEILN